MKQAGSLIEKNGSAIGVGGNQIRMAIVVQIVLPGGHDQGTGFRTGLKRTCAQKPAIAQTAEDRHMACKAIGGREIEPAIIVKIANGNRSRFAQLTACIYIRGIVGELLGGQKRIVAIAGSQCHRERANRGPCRRAGRPGHRR